jgi:hypothetical protein
VRLSAYGKSTVLLVEAGGEHRSPFITMPRGFMTIWETPEF